MEGTAKKVRKEKTETRNAELAREPAAGNVTITMSINRAGFDAEVSGEIP